jgi:hypothetical protein
MENFRTKQLVTGYCESTRCNSAGQCRKLVQRCGYWWKRSF